MTVFSAAGTVRWEDLETAIPKARSQGKPLYVFVGSRFSPLALSMEEESFSDGEISKLLNEDFVPVRVDREEAPVLAEAILMACHVMNGSGAVPLNLFATPDLKPFFVASYMPRKGSPNMPGLGECLPRMKWLWLTENESVLLAADEFMESLHKASEESGDIPKEETVKLAAENTLSNFDSDFGGFGEGGKFPSVQKLLFVGEFGRIVQCAKCKEAVCGTLDAMARGALRDHIGGGFFSFSMDREWKKPFFEKNLADQALNAIALAEGFDRYGQTSYWRAADEALAYASMELYNPGVGFVASQYEPFREGCGFYLWSAREVDEILGDEGELFRRSYGIPKEGSYWNMNGDPTGKSVPGMTESLEEISEREGFSDPGDLEDLLAKGCQRLASARENRFGLVRDERVFVDWNGLMVASLARCGRLMDRPNYIALAERTCEDVLSAGLEHCKGVPAALNDYAFSLWGALEVHRSTGKSKWLDLALDLERTATRLFSFDKGYSLSAEDGPGILFRRIQGDDGRLPSGASVMAGNLVTLWLLTGDDGYLQRARETVGASGGGIARNPGGYPFLLTALLRTMA